MSRARAFRLPGVQELSKQQDAALALPLEGQHLIIGGPGTGKSVVALLRARQLGTLGRPYTFLVYNHVLRQSNLHLFGKSDTLKLETWDAWFRNQYNSLTQQRTPTLSPAPNSDYRPIDWSGVDRAITELPRGKPKVDLPFVVIDEGQDMPPTFYKSLIDLDFMNFYVVADQNQQIHPDRCSSRQDIENSLCVNTDDTLELSVNYRNAFPVARLARAFYTDDPASPPPDLPPEARSALAPRLVTYGQSSTWSFDDVLERILKLSDTHPSKLIGIITPDNRARESFCSGLQRVNPRLDNGRPPIQTYASGQNSQLDFGHGGIMVLNAHSCKGLEFDTVILADIDRHQPKDVQALKARFYVMVARARERVIMLRTGQACPVVDRLLPTDPAILSRS